MNCHNGPPLSDGKYHHLSISFYGNPDYEGRYAVTGNPADMGRYRTPDLRGIMHTGPWAKTFPKRYLLIRPLHLTSRDIDDLKTFLESAIQHRHGNRHALVPQSLLDCDY